ncbi:hypothetical protein CR513_41758, partial [Mucuna pruriens]
MTLDFIYVLQYGLQSSSTCNKVTHFGAASDSLCSKLSVIPKLRPGNNCFIIWVLGLVMGSPMSHKLSLILLVGSLSLVLGGDILELFDKMIVTTLSLKPNLDSSSPGMPVKLIAVVVELDPKWMPCCAGAGGSMVEVAERDDGSFASYLLPAAAIGAMGYCYMWWKDGMMLIKPIYSYLVQEWSFSDVMFVTKKNMVNAVATVSKQLENVHETLASTKKHLTKRLEGLDLKLEEHNELGQLISDDVIKGIKVNEVKSNLSRIGCDIEVIHQMISGLEGKLELVEGKQDTTNSGLWYLCQFAEGFNDRPNGYKDIAEQTTRTIMTHEEKSLKGLQFIATTRDSAENSSTITKKVGLNSSNEKEPVSKPRIHRSFPVGISVSKGITGLACD